LHNTVKWVSILLFLYNILLGYVVVNSAMEMYKIPLLAAISVDCFLLFYFIAYVYELGSRRIMSIGKKKSEDEWVGIGIMKVNVEVLIGVIFIYNMLLGVVLDELTNNPFIVIAFLCADFFFIFYYVWLITMERLWEHKFKATHAELIKQAMIEIKSQKA
jgi:hypothetical protein